MSRLKLPTLGEMIVVGIIIAVMVALLFPVFARRGEPDAGLSCMSNEKQLGLGMIQYAQDSNDQLPRGRQGTAVEWAGQIFPYVKNTDVYHCPEDQTKGTPTRFVVSYGYNVNVAQHPVLYNYPTPEQTVLLFEVSGAAADVMRPDEGAALGATAFSAAGNGTDGTLTAGHAAPKYATGDLGRRPSAQPTQFTDPRHTGSSNFLLSDGHVKWLKPTQVSSGSDALKLTDGQMGAIHGTAASTQDTDYAATFSVK
jgi:prepilin-type processing-associated H-X9-DG protein